MTSAERVQDLVWVMQIYFAFMRVKRVVLIHLADRTNPSLSRTPITGERRPDKTPHPFSHKEGREDKVIIYLTVCLAATQCRQMY